MRIILTGDHHDEEVIAEPFAIAGSGEQFAVHRALDSDLDAGQPLWTATHVETGFAIARGHSIDETITRARMTWQSKTPEQIEQAKSTARLRKAARDAAGEMQP